MSHASIYFDESGFTGNNLMEPIQKIFSYAAVVSDDDEAKEIVEGVIAKYRIQGGEIKGGKLVKNANGRRALDEIIGRLGGRFRVCAFDKK
ncbi:hypothetical protein YA0057_25890, partial [Pseudomonas syringae]|nr:hypothetical protein [Pseudomonas syringae]